MKKLLGLLLLTLSLNTFAGSQVGKVESLVVRASDGLIYFTLKDGALSGRPACATIGYWMIKDENSKVGNQQYSMILSAHAAGKRVQIVGMNTCTRWRDGEDVNSITLLDD
ncbi:hypothetical protein EYS14_12850 [Alteromonadaceae bacterium M269]|nr:hypothetical protein EYS14_12850 [Alteromonadaceae bacterium M269]